MRLNSPKLRAAILVCAAAALLFLLLQERSPTEQWVQEARAASRKLWLLQSKQPWRSASLLLDVVRGRADEGRYVNIYRNSESNLLRAGYLEQRTFRFDHAPPPWVAISKAVDGVVPQGECYSCAFLTAEASIRVVARSNRMEAFERLVRDYDQPKQR